jgi:hypothetical protein
MLLYLKPIHLGVMGSIINQYHDAISGVIADPVAVSQAGMHGLTYRDWARELISIIGPEKKVILQLLDPSSVVEGRELHDISENIIVGVPCRDLQGSLNHDTVEQLHEHGVDVCVTGVCCIETAKEMIEWNPKIISFSVGKVEDTGRFINLNNYAETRADYPDVQFMWDDSRSIGDYTRASIDNWDIISMDAVHVERMMQWNLMNTALLETRLAFIQHDAAKEIIERETIHAANVDAE